MKCQTDTNAFPTETDPEVGLSNHSAQLPIHATIIGSDCCEALGVTAGGSAPVFALCRALLAAGHDPRRPLHAYRGDVLALVVSSIGEGAQLRVATHGVGWMHRSPAGSPKRVEGGQTCA